MPNAGGFVINLSADTLAEANELATLNVGPVRGVLDAQDGTRADTVTPAGRRVVQRRPAGQAAAMLHAPHDCFARVLSARSSSGSLRTEPIARPLPLWRVAKHHAPSPLQSLPRRRSALSPCRLALLIIYYRKKRSHQIVATLKSAMAPRAHGACRPRCLRLFRRPRTQPRAPRRSAPANGGKRRKWAAVSPGMWRWQQGIAPRALSIARRQSLNPRY